MGNCLNLHNNIQYNIQLIYIYLIIYMPIFVGSCLAYIKA